MLIVMGHVIEPLVNSNGFCRYLYVFIYSFHIPTFVFISGYFSSAEFSPGSIKKNVITLLVPYILFQYLFSLFIFVASGFETVNLTLLKPHNVMWYLLSLFTWRTLLPFIVKIRLPYIVILLIGTALIAGYCTWINRYLSFSRTIVFFPFFFLGYYVRKKNCFVDAKKIPRLVSLLLLCTSLLLSALLVHINLHWYYGDCAYRTVLENRWIYGPLFRLIVLSQGLITSLSFLSLVTDKKISVSVLGTRTMYVFLLHYIPIRLLEYLDFFSRIYTTIEVIIILLPISIVLTFILSLNAVKTITQPVVEPFVLVNKIRNKDTVSQ